MSKIDYKHLEKPLKMLFKVEIFEKTALKDNYIMKLFDIDILPDRSSFWSGNQNIDVLRKPNPPNTLPNNDPDAFVQQVSTVLHQLTLKLGFNGTLMSIEKQSELWRKWLAIRANLSDSYTGEWIDSALTVIDMKMLPGEALTHHIMEDLFISEYFRGVYDAPFVENNFNCKRTIYGLCPLPIEFKEKWTLQNAKNEQVIKFSGKWHKVTNQSEFDQWLNTKTGDDVTGISVDGFYQLDRITGWCNALESNYLLTANNSYEKTLKIKLTTN